MNYSDGDPFAYRSKGGFFNVGSEEGDTMSAFIEVDNQLLCITRKNIRTVVMADHVDPKRTNQIIQHNIQHVLSHGSDSQFVGRTLQQASILFKKHSLPKTIDHNKGISIALSFLKEITALEKAKGEYITEEESIKSNLSQNSHLPSLPNLEQKIKSFILSSDHTSALAMGMAHLFYPSVKGKGWESKLIAELKSPQQDNFIDFIEIFKELTEGIRIMRNKVEHPVGELKDDILKIENFKLTPENVVDLPSVCYVGKKYNYPTARISFFMESTVANLLTTFEVLMAYLCGLHAQPFAGNERIIVSVPKEIRQDSERHVGFAYQILWKN